MVLGAARLSTQGVEVGQALGPIGQRHHQLGQAHARVMTAPRHVSQHRLSPAVRPLRSATSPSHTSPPRDTRPSPSPDRSVAGPAW